MPPLTWLALVLRQNVGLLQVRTILRLQYQQEDLTYFVYFLHRRSEKGHFFCFQTVWLYFQLMQMPVDINLRWIFTVFCLFSCIHLVKLNRIILVYKVFCHYAGKLTSRSVDKMGFVLVKRCLSAKFLWMGRSLPCKTVRYFFNFSWLMLLIFFHVKF